MPKKYRTKNTMSKRLKKVEKQVAHNKPETKQIEEPIAGSIPNLAQVQINRLLCNPEKGTNSNQRIGDRVKATSYYGVFYVSLPDTGTLTNTGAVRMVHYLSLKPNESVLENNSGAAMTYDELPADKGYIIKEDKLLTLSKQGPAIRKVVFKGKYKYPINVSWETDNNKIGYHPRLAIFSDSPEPNNLDKMQINGEFRYYYTDA